MKNPNHYGTITKLKGTRRRPYIIKEGVTGRQKIVGYAATREEAMIILANYNRQPWNIDANNITFAELYELWLEKRAPKLGESNRKALKSAYNHCELLYRCKYNEIKPYQMQECIDECARGHGTQRNIKNLCHHLENFAIELDISQHQYSMLLEPEPAPESEKTIFTDAEIQTLWNNQDEPWVDSVLFLLYTGFRISEFVSLRLENVNLDECTIKGGVKTAAGKNRIVPIHSKIFDIVKNRVSISTSGRLFENNERKLTVNSYRKIWSKVMNLFEMTHTPHECRHTLRSRLDSVGANKVCIDRIIGHKSGDVGERVYTHKTIEELRKNIELITD